MHPTVLRHRLIASLATVVMAAAGLSAIVGAPSATEGRALTAPSAVVEPANAVETAPAPAPESTRTPASAQPAAAEGAGGLGPDCTDGFTPSAVAGCIREVGPGLSEVVQPDGERVTVVTPHGGATTTGHDDDHETFAAGTGSWSLDDVGRRSVSCGDAGTPRTVAVYAHREGQAQDGAVVRRAIRSVLERSNGLVASSARDSGGPAADLRMACTPGGAVSVRALVVPGPEYGEIRQAAVEAGHDAPHEKYMIFADLESPQPGVSGMAQRYADDRRSLDNHNNGRAPMHGVVWDDHWDGLAPLHELTHMMGGVQADAPGSDGAGHCTDSRDVMCYTFDRSHCDTFEYDCGHDTYFSTAPVRGSYLDTHWNIGWEGNRFVDVVGRPTPQPTPEPEESEADQDDDSSGSNDDGTVADSVGTVVDAAPLEEVGEVAGDVAEVAGEVVGRTASGDGGGATEEVVDDVAGAAAGSGALLGGP